MDMIYMYTCSCTSGEIFINTQMLKISKARRKVNLRLVGRGKGGGGGGGGGGGRISTDNHINQNDDKSSIAWSYLTMYYKWIKWRAKIKQFFGQSRYTAVRSEWIYMYTSQGNVDQKTGACI